MLTSAIGRRTLNQNISLRMRNVLLTLLVGLLAGNLILAVSGGFPLATSASAATELKSSAPASVLNLSYRLNPNNPAQVGEVHLQAETIQGNTPESVSVRLADQTQPWISCFERAGSWICPLSEVSLIDLTDLEVQAN